MGCPIRGVILDPFVALRMGIKGQVLILSFRICLYVGKWNVLRITFVKICFHSILYAQAGTQFWDENMENELVEGRLSSTAFDR
jgi:hypothetical protein